MSLDHRDSDLPDSPFISGDSSPSPSISQTPGEEEREEKEGVHFMPKRAMASFENLVAMANHQERLKEARKMVWRDKGQPVVAVETLEACLEHALTGGLRELFASFCAGSFTEEVQGSATLAFNMRACLNLVLALLRIHRVPRCARAPQRQICA